MKDSNCLAFVLTIAKYRRRCDHMLIRQSWYGKFPHFAAIVTHPEGLYKIEFVPVDPRKRWLPPLFFKGKIVVTHYQLIKKEEYHDKEHYRSFEAELRRNVKPDHAKPADC